MATRHKWEAPTLYSEYLESLQNPKHPDFELVQELPGCTHSFSGAGHAWIVHDRANDVICLQSFATVVSVLAGDEPVKLGNWSKTTTTHQNKFFDFYKNKGD